MMKAANGNQIDTKAFASLVEAHIDALKAATNTLLTLIADAALYTTKGLEAIREKNIQFISRVPRRLKEASATGCEHCNHTGYHGRQAITELFEVDDRVKMMIFEETSTVEILSYVTAQGMRTLKEDMFRLIAAGATTLEEFERVIL